MSASRSTRRKAALQENAMSKTDDGRRALYHCNYCGRDISEIVRIKCAECPDFDLCVECFSVGVELGNHKNTHAYRVMDYLSFPLYHPEWGADEELLLLEALEMYGIGNWQAVAEHVGVKPAHVCKAHYYQIYMESRTSPLPHPCPELCEVDISDLMSRKVRVSDADGRKGTKRQADGAGDDGGQPMKKVKTEAGKDGPRAELDSVGQAAEGEGGGAVAAPPADATDASAGAGRKQTGGKSTAKNTAGRPAKPSGPRTGQESGSGPQRIQHNKQEITGYMLQRDEFDPEYDAEAEMPIADMEFNDDDTPEMHAKKLRQLEIYNERLTERERRRELIKEHQLVDVRRLTAAERKRPPFDRRFLGALRVFGRFQDAANHDAFCEGLLLEARLRGRIAELKQLRREGARTFAEADAHQELKKRHEAGRPSARLDRNLAKALGADDAAAPTALAASNPLMDLAGAARGAGPALNAWRSKRGVQLDITCLPGVEELTRRERDLCANSRLLPSHYLLLKELMLREVEKHGPLTKADARTMFRLEPNRSQKVHELMVAAGWSSVKPAEPLRSRGSKAHIDDGGAARSDSGLTRGLDAHDDALGHGSADVMMLDTL